MKKQRGSVINALSTLTQVGVSVAACVIVGVFLGKYLDARLGTSPWLLIVCSLLGAGAALRSIFGLVGKRDDNSEGT